MSFENDLKNLKRLLRDSEKAIKEFNEIIPYEHNPNSIYSPKLVNLLLQLGPQIEGITDLILSKTNLSPENRSVPSKIEKINQNGVLSRFKIISLLDGIQFTPFPQKVSWWHTYNDTKHNLSQSQFNIKYLSVMDTLAALAGLHRLADVIKDSNSDNLKLVLDKQYWQENLEFPTEIQPGIVTGLSLIWKSEIFKISNYFVYNPNS